MTIKERTLTFLNHSLLRSFHWALVAVPHRLDREQDKYIYRTGDLARTGALELISREIHEKSIDGAVAELGVYKGNFAKQMNHLFPEKKLYLFDTFEGFDQRDIAIDRKNQFTSIELDNRLKDTSVEYVLEQMEHPEQCIVKQGYFPETAEGLDEKFCFVSIDVDLYQPIAHGLRYFYPRLAKGGFLFVHDYNYRDLAGSKKAVREFSEETGIPYVPMMDSCGSALFIK